MNKANYRVAIVVSQFHEEIACNLLNGALATLHELGVNNSRISTFKVPGAMEIPFACLQAIQKHKPHGIITLGCVMQGKTPHFTFVCNSVTQSIMNLSLNHNIPITFGVLTTNTYQQAMQRSDPTLNPSSHLTDHRRSATSNKGIDAAMSLWDMLHLSNYSE